VPAQANPDPLGDVAAFAALADERRRTLYDYVVAQHRPVSRDEAAGATDIGRPLAAYHLDRLAEAGLLDVVFGRPPGRAGPGAGRPAKRYVRPARALSAWTRARDYPFVARLLAEAVDRAGPALLATVRELASERGRALGGEVSSADGLEATLAARGYEPLLDADGTIRLANCPFHALAVSDPELVCGLNQAFVEGLLQGAGDGDRVAERDPCTNGCCIAIRPRVA
jgi:predicted ArsR family transcriptional regulator